MRYLVAVSGGVDSVVLLDILSQQKGDELIVAHFDHGIREDSADDARFVEALAGKYNVPFVTRREELGLEASEELARGRRYQFLRTQARRYDAVIATAHHRDDVIESIAINLHRGTGWRGLAVLDVPDVVRPLIHFSKSYVRAYALARRLEWMEDSTNSLQRYLRNRIRAKIWPTLSDHDKYALFQLWHRQVRIKTGIDYLLSNFVQESAQYQRYFFIMLDAIVAQEMLRFVIQEASGWSPTRPQCERALIAVKTARPYATMEIGSRVRLRFTSTTFVVENT